MISDKFILRLILEIAIEKIFSNKCVYYFSLKIHCYHFFFFVNIFSFLLQGSRTVRAMVRNKRCLETRRRLRPKWHVVSSIERKWRLSLFECIQASCRIKDKTCCNSMDPWWSFYGRIWQRWYLWSRLSDAKGYCSGED